MSTYATFSSPTPPSTTYRVAAIQYEPTFGEKEKNIRDLFRLVEEAASHEARLIVLPEMATTGYCWESREEIAPHVEPIPGPTCERFQQLATRYACFIAVSMAEVDAATDVYYNSVVLLGPHGIVGVYRKIHSYISEPRWARDGDLGMPVWETPLGRLSTLICMDADYFEAARIPALHGADVLLFPTNWLEEKSPSCSWLARAFENGVYLIAANRYGQERGVQFSGGSCIIDPDGSIQALQDNGEGIVYGTVDLQKSRNKRWGQQRELGDRLRDRQPKEYLSLVHNTYLWEPLHYHSLYMLGELPPGQLSCVGIVQMNMQDLPAVQSNEAMVAFLRDMLRSFMRDSAPAGPDILVLPELLLPGPFSAQQRHTPTEEELARHFRTRAIEVPGPETAALTALADELQISIVLGVAERAGDAYYNSVLLIDPEGVYGTYRKLHLTQQERLWATPGNLGLPVFDIPTGRIGLATGYDVLFPETVRVLAGKGVDLVCAPALLDFPDPIGLGPTSIPHPAVVGPDEYDSVHHLIWRLRASEHNVYLAFVNWSGEQQGARANGMSGIFPPLLKNPALPEVIADEGESMLTMMTIDTREQRTGRRTTHTLSYSPGDMVNSLTGELAYDLRDSIPGNAVRAKPMLLRDKEEGMRLANKVAIITGAAGGMGRLAAELFAGEGASVVVTDIAEQAGEETVRGILDNGGKAMFVRVDVSKEEEVRQMVEQAVARFGHVDVLYNNAGIMPASDGSVTDISETTWNHILDINLKSAFLCSKYVIPHMVRQGNGGSIINIASFVAFVGCTVPQDAYTVSKGGLLSLTKSLAVQYGPHRIRCNAICPGPIETPLLRVLWTSEEARNLRLNRIPLGRFGEARDIVYMALYLASDESSWTTGAWLMVDGGISSNYF